MLIRGASPRASQAPLTAKLISAKRIVGANAPGEVCHVHINSGPTFKYLEGQSLGVIPPGINPKNGKANSVRLYSIASTRYGDDLDGKSVSLCVRRATYWCPDLNAEDPAKKGVCSNFLCDAKPGDELQVTGPTGKVMLIPEHTPNADLIMVATGTGIAPYRGFIRRLFIEKTPAAAAFSGLAWLVLGVPTTDGLLYDVRAPPCAASNRVWTGGHQPSVCTSRARTCERARVPCSRCARQCTPRPSRDTPYPVLYPRVGRLEGHRSQVPEQLPVDIRDLAGGADGRRP